VFGERGAPLAAELRGARPVRSRENMSVWEGCVAQLWGEGEGPGPPLAALGCGGIGQSPAAGGGEAVLECEAVGTAPRAAPVGAALGASVFCFA
jgi:hypothetical protein